MPPTKRGKKEIKEMRRKMPCSFFLWQGQRAPTTTSLSPASGPSEGGQCFLTTTRKKSTNRIPLFFFVFFSNHPIFLGRQALRAKADAERPRPQKMNRETKKKRKTHRERERGISSAVVVVVTAAGPHAPVAPAFTRLFVRCGASVAAWLCLGSIGSALGPRVARVVGGVRVVVCGPGGVERRGKDVAKGRDIPARVMRLAGIVVVCWPTGGKDIFFLKRGGNRRRKKKNDVKRSSGEKKKRTDMEKKRQEPSTMTTTTKNGKKKGLPMRPHDLN